jgi:CDP-diacylglycerol--serine O-phosphatidyltransferase
MHQDIKTPKKLSIHKLIPNMITLAAMASGISSIKFAIDGKWEVAVLAIFAAMLMDAMDGAAARLLKASSKLGAELDSLSDFVSFGVAPAIVVFLWSTHEIGRWGWFISLVYAMAIALRLARFNIMKEEQELHPGNPLNRYFTGVPSPLAGGLCLMPLIISFLLQDHAPDFAPVLQDPMITGVWMLMIAALAPSHLPTFSSKQIRVPYRMKIPALGFFCLLVAGLINDPWPTLTLLGVAYIVSLPFGVMHYGKKEKALAEGYHDPEDLETDD